MSDTFEHATDPHPLPTRRHVLLGSAAAMAGIAVAGMAGAAEPPAKERLAAATPGEPAIPTTAPMAHLSGDIFGELHSMVTWGSDNLLDIARAEHLGLIEVMAANPGVDPWLPGAGKELVLPTAHILPDAPRRGIVINLAELRIYYFDNERGAYTFPIGVGREGFGTPIGTTKVTRKVAGPTWYPTAGKRAENPDLPAVVPPGPDNPLGEFALYVTWPAYLIHGTYKPYGVGRRVSRGCIRMYPEDIAFVYRETAVGTPVTTVLQPVKVGKRDGQVWLEVHPSLDQIDQIEAEGQAKPEPLPDQTDRILAAAGEDGTRIDWQVVEQIVAERRGIPVKITR